MKLFDLLSLPIAGKNVIVIGSPAAGKTHLANLLYREGHKLIHTDETINAGYSIPQACYSIFEDVKDYNRQGKATIVEGILGYTLLLEGLKQGYYRPDIIIDVQINRGRQRQIYLAERDPDNLKYLQKFQRMNLGLFNEWFNLCPPEERPQYIEFKNEFSNEQHIN